MHAIFAASICSRVDYERVHDVVQGASLHWGRIFILDSWVQSTLVFCCFYRDMRPSQEWAVMSQRVVGMTAFGTAGTLWLREGLWFDLGGLGHSCTFRTILPVYLKHPAHCMGSVVLHAQL